MSHSSCTSTAKMDLCLSLVWAEYSFDSQHTDSKSSSQSGVWFFTGFISMSVAFSCLARFACYTLMYLWTLSWSVTPLETPEAFNFDFHVCSVVQCGSSEEASVIQFPKKKRVPTLRFRWYYKTTKQFPWLKALEMALTSEENKLRITPFFVLGVKSCLLMINLIWSTGFGSSHLIENITVSGLPNTW